MADAVRRASQRLLSVCSFGQAAVPYDVALQLQEGLVALRRTNDVPDTVLRLQHLPVFTLGKRGTDGDVLTAPEEMQRLGAEVHRSTRGGQATFHGPGQVVLYPIVNLRELGMGARRYVETLEDTMVLVLGSYGLHARGRVPGRTGVWIGERKIGAIGVRITHGITSHGLALNVSTDLRWFDHIVACGVAGKRMTSLQEALGANGSDLSALNGNEAGLHPSLVASKLTQTFARLMGYQQLDYAEVDTADLQTVDAPS